MNIVIGATGWQAQEPRLRAEAEARGIGVVAAPNFAIGVNLFLALAERAAELWRDQPAFGAWLHELHHAAKRDAPSGTALAIEAAMRAKGYAHPIDMASTRAGSIPGHAHRRLRRRRRDDHADAHGARPHGVRARRAAGGALAARPPRLVHDEGRAGGVTLPRVRGSRVRIRIARLPASAGRLREAVQRLAAATAFRCARRAGRSGLTRRNRKLREITCADCGQVAARRWSRHSRATARSMRPACAGWRGARSTPACISSSPAARRARARRCRRRSGCASSRWWSRRPPAACPCSPAPAATTRAR